MTQSQLAILRAAACTIEEKPIPRPAEQHELVKQGVEHIVEEQQEPQIICSLGLFEGETSTGKRAK